jgi:hypothetical protein
VASLLDAAEASLQVGRGTRAGPGAGCRAAQRAGCLHALEQCPAAAGAAPAAQGRWPEPACRPSCARAALCGPSPLATPPATFPSATPHLHHLPPRPQDVELAERFGRGCVPHEWCEVPGGALAASNFHGGALHCRLLSLQGGACIAATSYACSARGLLTGGRRCAAWALVACSCSRGSLRGQAAPAAVCVAAPCCTALTHRVLAGGAGAREPDPA